MVSLEERFKNWLLQQGLSEKTPTGIPSTIYDYITTINRVRKKEGHLSWDELAVNVMTIIPNYTGKSKTALTKYNEFLFETDIPPFLQKERFKKSLSLEHEVTCLKTRLDEDTHRIVIDDKRDFFTPKELAAEWHITTRTLKKWRKEGKGPRYVKIGERIQYPKNFVEDYYNRPF